MEKSDKRTENEYVTISISLERKLWIKLQWEALTKGLSLSELITKKLKLLESFGENKIPNPDSFDELQK